MTKSNNQKLLYITPVFIAFCFIGCSQTTEKASSSNVSLSTNPSNTNVVINTANMTKGNNNSALNTQTGNISANSTTKNNKPPTKMPTPNIGKGGDDFSLFLSTRQAISVDKELVGGIIIEVKDGNVILNGKVANAEQKKKAEDLLRKVKGIKSVTNNLRIS